MSRNHLPFTKELGQLLVKYRKNANMSQEDIAKQMKFSKQSGKGFISRLEKGKIKDPYLRTILNYLNACNVSWTKYFGDLANIYSAKTHHEIMTQVKLPDNPKLVKKIDRDLSKYRDNIKTQFQPTKLDSALVKTKVERKIKSYLVSMNTDEKSIRIYLDFCFKVMERELSSTKSLPVDEKLWICSGIRHGFRLIKPASGIRAMLFPNLRRMVIKIVTAEKKKAIEKKPPSSEKQKKMALGYAKYLANIEPIEAEVHKMLCYIVVPEESYRLYKSFARACYKIIKNDYNDSKKITEIMNNRRYQNISPKLKDSLFEQAVQKWVKLGLKEEVLVKVKDLVVGYFYPKHTISQ